MRSDVTTHPIFFDSYLSLLRSCPFQSCFSQAVHEFSIGCLAYSQSGDVLASGGDDFSIQIIDSKSNTKCVTLMFGHDLFHSIPSHSICTSSAHNTGHYHRKTITHHTDFVRTLVWTGPQESPSLVSGSWDYSIALHTGLLFGNLDQAN
eukprot:TRINITY_DN1734_c0_g1_i1.p1 TRINITY_DN1734_c0_g1~~TRINITY_DN1734_c0_g1_i1.p1  ORF type:complete len:149 (-),score=15.34 TRINITY_DN1734_c0_g1_i1:10-456(-)